MEALLLRFTPNITQLTSHSPYHTHSISHTRHHTLNITRSTSHTWHHTLKLRHPTSHTQHHTSDITHSTSHTQYHTTDITLSISYTLNITHPTSHTQHHTPNIKQLTSHSQYHTHSISHTRHHTLNITRSTSHTEHHTLNVTHPTSHTWLYLGSILSLCYMIQTWLNYTCGVIRSFNSIFNQPVAHLPWQIAFVAANNTCSLPASSPPKAQTAARAASSRHLLHGRLCFTGHCFGSKGSRAGLTWGILQMFESHAEVFTDGTQTSLGRNRFVPCSRMWKQCGVWPSHLAKWHRAGSLVLHFVIFQHSLTGLCICYSLTIWRGFWWFWLFWPMSLHVIAFRRLSQLHSWAAPSVELWSAFSWWSWCPCLCAVEFWSNMARHEQLPKRGSFSVVLNRSYKLQVKASSINCSVFFKGKLKSG